jgi:GT2 family glycosyltransferase/glycosyltransferase involved in cell wall biosynthesis
MKKHTYKVSAIISTYNSEMFIENCLNNLINQSLHNKNELEIIIIDSNSEQNEGKIVKDFQQKSCHIKYFRTETRESIYKSWNRGCKISSGKYLTNANTDDCHRFDALEKMASVLDSDKSIALVYADVFVTNYPNQTFDNHIRCGYHIRPNFEPQIMLTGCHMGPQPMWRREIHSKIGWFDETFISAGDYDFWCRIALHYNMRHISEFLGLYYENPQGICNSAKNLSAKETKITKEKYQHRFPQTNNKYTNNLQYTEKITEHGYVNICIITFNRIDFTKKSIQSVLINTKYPHVITVVDNNSTDGTKEYLTKLHNDGIIKNLILLDENIGVAAASNIAWQTEPEAEYYLKFDNDIVIQKKDWLKNMVQTTKHIPQIGVLGYNFEPKSYPLHTINGFEVRIKEVDNIGGACILIPKRTEARIGFWCEDYGLYGEEDADMGWRVRLSGLLNAYMPDENIGFHLPGGKAAVVDRATWGTTPNAEASKEKAYREWKDSQRKKNFIPNSQYKTNIASYKSGSKSLFVHFNSKIHDYQNFIYSQKIETPLVSIIIPVYNNLNLTKQCIDSIYNNTSYQNYEIIIIDNNSTDGTDEYLASISNRIRVIKNDINLGFAKATNQGAKIANGEYLILLNNDTIPLNNWMKSLVYTLQSSNKIGIVGSKLLYSDNSIQHCGVVFRRDIKFFKHPYKYFERNHSLVSRYREVDAVTGACLIISKKIFFECEMLDEKYLNGCEDIDLCCAVRSHGYKIIYQPLSEVYHLESQTPRDNNFDKKNFTHFIDKWGKNALQTEHEFYVKDGLWKKDDNNYFIVNTGYLQKWTSILDDKSSSPNDKIRVKLLLQHLYSTKKWPVRHNNDQNNTPCTNKQTSKPLFVCHNFPPHSTGGAQKYAFELAQKLNQNSVVTHALYPEFSNNEKHLRISANHFEGLQVYKLHKETTYGFSQSVRHEGVFKIFDNLLSANDYNIIHIHSLGQLSASPIEVAKKHSKTIVLTLHDLWFLCFFWFMTTPDQKRCSGPDSPEKCARCFIKYFHVPNKSELSFKEVVVFFRYRQEYFKQMFDLADYKLAPSQYLIDEYKRFGYTGITLSPLGFEHITPSEKTNSKNIRFGYIGNISIRKGVNLLIDAFEHIHKIFPNTQLNIHGNSSEPVFLDYVTNRVATHPAMHYSGKYTPEDLSRIFSDIDILIAPSLWENFPLVVQESFQHKTPVIASNIAGFPEIIQNGQTGLLFTVGDTQDLAEKLLFICSKPEMIQKFRNNISPVRSIQDDVELYLNFYNKGTSNIPSKYSSPVSIEKSKILFYFFKNVHIPILLPLYNALKALKADMEIGFSYLPPSPQIRAGLLPDEVRILEQTGVPIHAAPQAFHPDMTFIADSVYPWVEGCGKLVHVGHGVLSKGQYYTDTPTARREELADLVCVPGKHHQGIMRRIISKPVVATGMCKLDDLFSGKINRASVIKQFGLPDNYRYVLFAPTFNDELSAIPFVQERIGQVLPDDKTLVIIKLHPSTKAEYKEMYRALPGKDKRIIFADELDITPFLALCDVMISDVSSAMMEFAALDKPVILFNNPNWTSYQNYNPADIEFQWRDIGIQVSSLEEMREAVSLCLQNPGLHADKRKKYTDLLFANKRDGKAAERIVKLALSLLEAEQKR